MKKECVKCGKCKSVCPTYRITKTEDKSPRGRCHIASLVNSGFYHEGFIESLGSCLHCLACEEVCPRGVDITDEIINARAKLFLSGKYKKIPDSIASSSFYLHKPAKISKTNFHSSSHKVCALFLGCVIPLKYPFLVEKILSFLKDLAYRVEIPEAQVCCGHPFRLSGDIKKADSLFCENRRIFEEYDEIITACATCSHYLKKYYNWENKVKDITELIIEFADIIKVKPEFKDLKISFHFPCHLVRGQNIKDSLNDALFKIFSENYIPTNIYECCGFGGSVSVNYPKISMETGRERLKHFISKNVELIVTDCPACMLQLEKINLLLRSNIKVSHIVEVLEI